MPKQHKTGIFDLKQEKNKNHHRVLHIWMSLGPKFELQQRILISGPNLPKKDTSCRKQRKWTSPLNYSYSN